MVDGRLLLQPVKDELGSGYDVRYFAEDGEWALVHLPIDDPTTARRMARGPRVVP